MSVTFDEPGTYDITCEIHPSMQMTVIVEGIRRRSTVHRSRPATLSALLAALILILAACGGGASQLGTGRATRRRR